MSTTQSESAGSAVPLRVALVLSALTGAGAERQTVSLAAHFDRARVVPTVVALKRSAISTDTSLGTSTVAMWTPEMDDGLDWSGAWRLARYLRESRFDVILCANQYATLVVLTARRLSGLATPVLSVFHSSPGHIRNDIRSRVQFMLYRLALHKCAGLVYVSDLQKKIWEERGLGAGITTTVVNNGIDVTPFSSVDDDGIRQQLGWQKNHYVVGICAHLRSEKRVLDLVIALRLLLDRGLPARLLIVGDGPCRQEIERACHQQFETGQWAMVGMQSHVAPFIQACNVMALVSEAEAFSVGVLEAMASSKPLVITDTGGAREQIVPGIHGYIVPVGEPDKVADSLEKLWRGGDMQQIGAAARSRVAERFSVESMTDRYTKLLVAVASGSSPQSIA